MAHMDVFNDNAFGLIEMSQAIEAVPHLPTQLGQLNIFAPVPVRTEMVSIERRDGVLSVIQTSQRGDPLGQRTTEKPTIRNFRTGRVAKSDTINAAEIQGIRAFGSESEFMQVQAEVARRLAGPTGLLALHDMTEENMRLGAIQGIVLDADGSTIINHYTEWGVAAAAEVDFDLDAGSPASGILRKRCDAVTRAMMRASKGAMNAASQIHALCGDGFWDDLIAHTEVRATYTGWAAAADLRTGTAFGAFPFGGIMWHNYRGTDDNSTIAINTDKAKFFPVNAPGVFQAVYSPGEFLPVVNTPGQPRYALTIPDRDRQAWVKVETYSYPLFMCTRPEVLQSARRT